MADPRLAQFQQAMGMSSSQLQSLYNQMGRSNVQNLGRRYPSQAEQLARRNPSFTWDTFPQYAAQRGIYDSSDIFGNALGLSFPSLGPSAMAEYADMVPEAIDFQRWYYPWLQEQMQQEPEPYPGGWNVEPHPYEGELMDMQRDRIGQVPDLAAAYEGAFEDYLPAYRRAYDEQTLKPAQERLEQMGMGDSAPGMGFLAGLGEDQAITEAALGRDMQLGQADARQQMYNLEGAQMGTLWDMSQPHYQRGIQRQQFEYGDWLRQQGQPVDYAAQLGAPQAAMGVGSNLAQMYSSGMAASASKYSTDMGLHQSMAEMDFMAPFMAMSMQPIQQSGGKK